MVSRDARSSDRGEQRTVTLSRLLRLLVAGRPALGEAGVETAVDQQSVDSSQPHRSVTSPGTRLERAGAAASRISSLRPSDPNLRRGLHAGIGVVIMLSVGLAAAAAFNDLSTSEWRLRPTWLVPAVAGFAALQLLNAELWRRLVLTLGPSLTRRTGTAIWCGSALGRYVPTSMLMPVMRVAMAERAGVPKRISLASVVYELALAFAAGLVVAAYFVIDLPALDGRPERFLAVALPLIALLVLQPRIFHPVADWTLRRLGRETLPVVLGTPRVFEFLVFYAATYVLAGVSLYMLAQAVYPVGSDEVVAVIGAFAVGQALSFLAFMIPSGLVAREAGVALALSPALPAGPAVAIAVLMRIIQLGLELVLAAVTSLAARSGPAAGPVPGESTGVAAR